MLTSNHLTTWDLCEIFSVSRSTIYNWRKKGMPFIKLSGSEKLPVRFKLEKVTEWVVRMGIREEHEIKPMVNTWVRQKWID